MLKNMDMKQLIAHGFELARFGIVGVAATLVHLGVAFLLSQNTDIPLIAINIMAFAVAFGVSFFGHHHWTFQSKTSKKESFFKFFLIALSGLAASTLILSILIKLDISTDLVKLLISIVIIPVVTYLLSKFWAFRGSKRMTS